MKRLLEKKRKREELVEQKLSKGKNLLKLQSDV